MTKIKRLALVCEGNAEIPGLAFSGSAHSLLTHLRALGHPVASIDTKLRAFRRGIVAARSFTPDRSHWRARFRYGEASACAKSRLAEHAFTALNGPVDVVLQIGAAFHPPARDHVPYALYCDWNFALSLKNSGSSHSVIHRMPSGEAERINAREAEICQGAAVIFAFSERLRQSFIDDYHIPASKVVNVRAGPNIDLARMTPPDRAGHRDRAPTILFIGKEFERKGGDTVLQAFAGIRRRIPNARLIIAGPPALTNVPAGVDFLGLLRKDDPVEFERLLDAYREADVFCLPSRQDPFPTVVREAMFFSLPCVTSDIWAMPEMVVDCVTGYVVPPDEPTRLADRLLTILENPEQARSMGAAGRVRANELYTWDAVARAMHEELQRLDTWTGA